MARVDEGQEGELGNTPEEPETPGNASERALSLPHDEPTEHSESGSQGGPEGREVRGGPAERTSHTELDWQRSGGAGVGQDWGGAAPFGSGQPTLPGVDSQLTWSASFSGPIPPPQVLGAYDQVQAGLADRIVRMAESALEAENEVNLLDKKAEAFSFRAAVVGITYFPWLAIIAAVVLAVLGEDFAALIAGAAGLLIAGPQIIAAIRGGSKNDDDSQDTGSGPPAPST